MVEWGSSFTAAFARHFPDAPLPTMRMNVGHAAMAFLLECGGSAYLPESLAAEHLKAGRLHKVKGAPEIERRVYAVYQGYGERRALVEEALAYPADDRAPSPVYSSSLR